MLLAVVAVIAGSCLAIGAVGFGGYLRDRVAGHGLAEHGVSRAGPAGQDADGSQRPAAMSDPDPTRTPEPHPNDPAAGSGRSTGLVCPPGPTSEDTGASNPAGRGQAYGVMVPFEPADGLLCTYGPLAAQGPRLQGSRSLDRTTANRFRAELNALPAVRPGTYACPADDGSAYAVILEVDGAAHTVWVKRSGCPVVTDGIRLRRPSAGLDSLFAG